MALKTCNAILVNKLIFTSLGVLSAASFISPIWFMHNTHRIILSILTLTLLQSLQSGYAIVNYNPSDAAIFEKTGQCPNCDLSNPHSPDLYQKNCIKVINFERCCCIHRGMPL